MTFCLGPSFCWPCTMCTNPNRMPRSRHTHTYSPHSCQATSPHLAATQRTYELVTSYIDRIQRKNLKEIRFLRTVNAWAREMMVDGVQHTYCLSFAGMPNTVKNEFTCKWLPDRKLALHTISVVENPHLRNGENILELKTELTLHRISKCAHVCCGCFLEFRL